jgi:TonB-linked SusC/RagA family outer membrane protein
MKVIQKSKIKYYAAVCLFVFAGAWASAQTLTITGTVSDVQGEPLPGVNIRVQGTITGTTTDVSGKYSIAAPGEQSVLQFSFIGFTQQDVVVGSQRTVNVTLEEDVQQLDEVVVIGYGTVKRANVVGSISKVTAREIANRPVARVDQALQGQMAGVSVRSTSGAPGEDLQIRVRGAASITGETTPLYIVDGVPVSTLQSVNPGDIESIDVLKDAASASIYGARGSNGVVLVTTKRGKAGAPVITFNGYVGLSTLERKVEVLDPYEWIAFNKKWLDRQAEVGGYGRNSTQAERLAAARADGLVVDTRDQMITQRNKYGLYDPWWAEAEAGNFSNIEPIDWQDEVYRTAPVSDLQLSVAGGRENTNYLVSVGRYEQQGLVHNSSFERYTVRAKFDARLTDHISIGVNVAPSFSTQTGVNVDGKDNGIARTLSYGGWVPAGAGKYAGADPYKFYAGWGAGANNVSPYVLVTAPYRQRDNVRLMSSFNTTLKLFKGFSVTGMAAWNYRYNMERSNAPTWMSGTWDTAKYPGERSNSRFQHRSEHDILLQALANYDNTWGEHDLSVVAGAEQSTSNAYNTDQGQTNFPYDNTWVFSTTTGNVVNQNTIGYSANAIVSYFGRAQYTFRDRYIVTASVRRDGSSRFGPGNRWGNFPSVSGAWKFSEENFMQGFDWLSSSKIRVSWGLAGNDRIGTAQYLSSMAARDYPLGSGFVRNNLSNSMLGWESTASTNVGLDLGLLRNRIAFSIDYYTKVTDNLLLDAPISPITGFTKMMDNVGKVHNWGMEFDLNSMNIDKKDFSWSTTLNLSFNRNEILELTGDNADIVFGGTVNGQIQRKGHPVNSYYLYNVIRTLRASDFEADGITPKPGVAIYSGQKPGDSMWENTNDEGSSKGVINAADKKILGSYEPDFEWGITNNFRYKNWDLSVFINGRQGGTLFSVGSRAWNRATNGPTWQYLDRWLYDAYWNEDEPGDGKTPGFFSTVTGNQPDSNWLYDATYIRIKNIRLGYTLNLKPNKYVQRAHFYVSCDNVKLWDHYDPGYSPEGGTQDNATSEWGAYPIARTYSAGINITF